MALTASQIAERLLKKVQGVAETKFPLDSRGILEEATSTYNLVTPDSIWFDAAQIPNTPPVLSHSQSSGVVRYYEKLQLVQNDAGTTVSYRSPANELKDAISGRFGFGYNFKVYGGPSGNTQIFKGDWLVDAESGVLTFYNIGLAETTINPANPPYITFYKYIGTKGAGSGTMIGVTAGKGLTGGGTSSHVTLDLNLGINSGLTFSGDELILDSNLAGNGLDFSSGVLTVNTSEINTGLAGSGLTANGSTLDVNVNSDSLEIDNDVIRLKDTITGDRTFQDSVTINGNLTVNGTASYVYTENLVIEDNLITLNATVSGTPILNAGIEVNRGNETNASLLWNETTDLWTAGLSGSEVSILLNTGTGLVKNGSTVSLDFSNITGTGLTQNGSQIFIDTAGFSSGLAGDGLSSNGGTLSVNVGNGLSINTDIVGLGGTLSQTTLISGSGYDITIGDINTILFTSSVFDVESDFVSIDAGTGSMQLLADGDMSIVSNDGQLNLGSDIGRVTTGNLEGLVYTSDYSGTFVTNSLVSKGYVDSLISSVGATNGLTEYSPGEVGLGGTLSQNTTINGNLNDLTFGNIDSLTVTASLIDFQLDNGSVFIDTGENGNVDIYSGGILLFATYSIDLVTNVDFTINAATGSVTTTNLEGLVYTSDYSGTFVTNSLVTKGYVDSAVPNVGAGNGLQELSPAVVGLGGTLSQNTNIDGDNFDLTIRNIDSLTFTSSVFDVESDFVSIDAGTGSMQLLADGDMSIVSNDGQLNLGSDIGRVTTGNLEGLVYTSDYSGTFVTNSLVSKKYVDQVVGSISSIAIVNADNGLEIVSSGVIGIGGTLSRSTMIKGDSYDLTIGNIDSLTFTSSIFDVESDFISLDAGTGSAQLLANGSISIVSLNESIDLAAQSSLITISNLEGLVYASDYSSTFVTHSLVTKKYVDVGTSSLWSVISSINTSLAGNGLTANGISLDVNVESSSLEIVGDLVRLKNSITGDRTFQDSVTIGGNLTVNGTTSYIHTENLLVQDNLITLNATWSGSPLLNSGIEVNRGTETNATLVWNELTDLWTAGLSGSEASILLNSGTGLTKNGSTVSLDFTSITGTGLTQNGSQISIDTVGFAGNLAGDGLIANGGTLSVNVGNGLSINTDIVGLGGTLSQTTLIFGNDNDLTISGVNTILFTSSVFDVESDFISLDAGTGSMQLLADGDMSIVSLTGDLSIGGNSGKVTIGNNQGLVYTSDYSLTFVTNSLVSKKYVDDVVGVINADFITGLTAGKGLSGGGTSGFITLDVNVANGLEVVSDTVYLGGTLSQNTNIEVLNNIFSISGNGVDEVYFDSNQISINKSDGGFSSSTIEFKNESTEWSIELGLSQSLITITKGELSLDGSTNNNMLVRDDIGTKGLVYYGDYTSNFTTHSLVTKGYVDTSIANVGATNGVSEFSPGFIGLGGTLSQATLINGDSYDFTIGNVNNLAFTSSIFDVESDFISLDAGTGSMQLLADGEIDLVSLTGELSIGGNSGKVTIGNNQGLVYTSDYTLTFVTNSLVTKAYVDSVSLSGLTAGPGLTGGGSQGDVSLSIELDNNSGLTFSVSGDGGKLKASVDSTSIGINTSGQLYAISGASVPVYQYSSPSNTIGDGSSTGLSLSQTPSQYSRLQVYINGQLQLLGNGVTSSVDCYFSSDGGTTAKNLNSCVSGDTLYWNGNYALFDLDNSDDIYIVYEN